MFNLDVKYINLRKTILDENYLRVKELLANGFEMQKAFNHLSFQKINNLTVNIRIFFGPDFIVDELYNMTQDYKNTENTIVSNFNRSSYK